MKFDSTFYDSSDGLYSTLEEEFPQKLCLQSGNCCRLATNFFPHEKLMELAEQGNQEAKAFLDIFIPYENLDAVCQVSAEHVDNVLTSAKADPNMDVNKVSFYHCRHISDDNLCMIYERRPKFCVKMPHNGWALVPPACGFNGWQFEYREKQKKLIRGLKETLYIMEMLSEDGVKHPTRSDITIPDLQRLVQDKIKPWQKYGAAYW